jgi:hypothetical protein
MRWVGSITSKNIARFSILKEVPIKSSHRRRPVSS